MTGRRLYEHACTARYATLGTASIGTYTSLREGYAPVAWDFLPFAERRFWNDLAKRVAPPKRKARA